MKYLKNTIIFAWLKPLFLIIALAFFNAGAQTTVNSLEELLPYLEQSNANIKLAPGEYTITPDDVTAEIYGNPLLLIEGDSSTYDFTDVTINIETQVLKSFGKVDVKELQITGNYNILKNLTMVDVGDINPAKSATNITIDGLANTVESFHLTVRGSYPYGYGDAFGKGGTNNIIAHYKHSAILVRGKDNHLKNTSVIHRSFGHAIFMQAAENPTIEGCYVEGEVRSTDDMLAEEGTGTKADEVEFMTTWGYKIPAGYMMSTGEGGIRAYNAGETVIDGIEYSRGTTNVTVKDCTVKFMRTGVTLTHAKGTNLVENTTTIGCERGFAVGSSGKIVNCSADARYGFVYGVDYETDKNAEVDITILPVPKDSMYNGSGMLAYIAGNSHNITFTTTDTTTHGLEIRMSGENSSVRISESSTNGYNLASSGIKFENITNFPILVADGSSNADIETCAKVTDNGVNTEISESDKCADLFAPEEIVSTYNNNNSSKIFSSNVIDNNITLNNYAGGVISIYSVTGALIKVENILSQEQSIDISSLNNGIYLMKLNYNNQNMVQQVIKN